MHDIGAAVAAGLRHEMTHQLLDAVDLEVFLFVTGKEAHAIYQGHQALTLNQLGAVAEWLDVPPDELIRPELVHLEVDGARHLVEAQDALILAQSELIVALATELEILTYQDPIIDLEKF
jgi:hypothetical protein